MKAVAVFCSALAMVLTGGVFWIFLLQNLDPMRCWLMSMFFCGPAILWATFGTYLLLAPSENREAQAPSSEEATTLAAPPDERKEE